MAFVSIQIYTRTKKKPREKDSIKTTHKISFATAAIRIVLLCLSGSSFGRLQGQFKKTLIIIISSRIAIGWWDVFTVTVTPKVNVSFAKCHVHHCCSNC